MLGGVSRGRKDCPFGSVSISESVQGQESCGCPSRPPTPPEEVGVNQPKAVCAQHPLGPEGSQEMQDKKTKPGHRSQGQLPGKLPLRGGAFKSPLSPFLPPEKSLPPIYSLRTVLTTRDALLRSKL